MLLFCFHCNSGFCKHNFLEGYFFDFFLGICTNIIDSLIDLYKIMIMMFSLSFSSINF